MHGKWQQIWHALHAASIHWRAVVASLEPCTVAIEQVRAVLTQSLATSSPTASAGLPACCRSSLWRQMLFLECLQD